jgi:ABC-type molybdate transport system permease subunit
LGAVPQWFGFAIPDSETVRASGHLSSNSAQALALWASWLMGTPLAWWLARTRSRFKAPLSAIVALPMVLPPTVLGFYLLVMLGPNGPLGQFTHALGWG